MADINKIRRCYSCGAILQCEDEKKEGFVNKEVFENSTQNFLFCNKCFEDERFKQRTNEPLLEGDFVSLLSDAKEKNALIVYVVNLLSFEASFIHQVNDILHDMNILVVGNKFDLLPEGTSKEDMKEYVAHRFRAAGLNIDAKNVIVANAFDDETAKEVMTEIYERKNGRDIYLIGSHLSGKTTLISSFLRVISNLSSGNIVTEPYPNTTLNVMKIPLTEKTAMYDTPGLSIDNSILYNLDKSTFAKFFITKPLKPRVVSLSPEHCLFLGGVAMLEFVKGKKTTFTCYFRDDLSLRKTFKATNEKNPVDKRFLTLIKKESLKPTLTKIKSIKDLDVYEINITESNYRDIGILGLGWLSFEANNQIFRIYLPKNVSMYHSRSKIINKKKD